MAVQVSRPLCYQVWKLVVAFYMPRFSDLPVTRISGFSFLFSTSRSAHIRHEERKGRPPIAECAI